MNFSMFRVVRMADQTPTKEVIKEFLRFIGCMISDHPVKDLLEAKSIMGNTPDAVDILLGFDCLDLHGEPTLEISSGREGRALFVDPRMPGQMTKKNYYVSLIGGIIDSVWTNEYSPGEEGSTQRAQLKQISQIFFKEDLFGYFQSKRSLRIINMPEVFGRQFGFGEPRQKIPISSAGEKTKTYIENMLAVFDETYKSLSGISQPGVYARYAKVNIARKIREVHDDFIIAEDGKLPDAKALLRELDDLYDLDHTYMGTMFLAAAVCKSDPSLYLTSSNYLRLLLDTIQDREAECYSFAYYEYGRHLERVYRDWEHAIAYYERALKLHKQNYQAKFKMGCYEAQHKGDYSKAIEIFQELHSMIAENYSGDRNLNYKNLSLKSIQYLYKTDIWLWILSKELGYDITADISLRLASLDASQYRKNKCVKEVYDAKDSRWEVLQEYHENSFPVRIMVETVEKELNKKTVEN